MSIIDLRHIPPANKGGNDVDKFELFARDFLEALGFGILAGPSRGQDGGCDLLVEEPVHGLISHQRRRWLVSVKHFAHSGTSVGVDDERNPLERVDKVGAQGFLGFYSTIASSSLETLFRGLSHRFSLHLFDSSKLISELLSNPRLTKVLRQYFPGAYATLYPANRSPTLRVFTDGFLEYDHELDLRTSFGATQEESVRFTDPDLEDLVAACLLAQAIRSGRYSALRGFFSLRPLVWREFLRLTIAKPLDTRALVAELESSSESHYLRLLINLAGHAKVIEAAEPICKIALYDGLLHSETIRRFQIPCTPFFDVCQEALLQLPSSILPMIEQYRGLAKSMRRWKQKQLFDNVALQLKSVSGSNP